MKDINELFEIADNNLEKTENESIKFYKEVESFIEVILTTIDHKKGKYDWNKESEIIPKSGGEFRTCKYEYNENGLKITIDYSWECSELSNPCGLVGTLGFDREHKVNFEKVKEILANDGIIITRKQSHRKTEYNYGTHIYTDKIIIEVPREKGKGQYTIKKTNHND